MTADFKAASTGVKHSLRILQEPAMLNARQSQLFLPLGQRFVAKTPLICSCLKGAYGRGKPVYRNRSDAHQIFTVNAKYNPVNNL